MISDQELIQGYLIRVECSQSRLPRAVKTHIPSARKFKGMLHLTMVVVKKCLDDEEKYSCINHTLSARALPPTEYFPFSGHSDVTR